MENESGVAQSGNMEGIGQEPAGTPQASGQYKRGGRVKRTGRYKVHKGELIVRKSIRSKRR